MYKLFILSILLFSAGCAHERQLFYYSAPTVLPHVSTEMKSPGFWVSRLSAPDAVVMDERQIREFNQGLTRTKLRYDIAAFPGTFSGKALKVSLEHQFKEDALAGYFTKEGKKAGKKFFALIEKNLALENIPEQVQVRCAVVVANADQRVLPTMEIVTLKPLDVDFDELQNSAFDINTPVAVLWQSADGLWSYVVGPSSSGWVLTRKLGWCSHDIVKEMRGNDFVVVSEAKADVYLDKERSRFYGFVRMGARFEVKSFSGDIFEVALPTRDEQGNLKLVSGYIGAKDVHRGYLPYTRRVIIEQAFELLNTPYGWGGANGEQDCSQFLQEVFATVGVGLPRNSSAQAKAGELLYEFAENECGLERAGKVIARAEAGISLLYMKGHIMLYLGQVDQRPYAIHDTWAYRARVGAQETPMLINKVTVSDLELGEGSQKGSLLERLQCVRMVGLADR